MLYSGTDPESYITEYTIVYHRVYNRISPSILSIRRQTHHGGHTRRMRTTSKSFACEQPHHTAPAALSGVLTKKVDIRLPGKGNSNSHGARPVY